MIDKLTEFVEQLVVERMQLRLRVQDLLESNNAFEARARAAEGLAAEQRREIDRLHAQQARGNPMP
jgi:hypothetical protein